jgi:homocysteine S-methyltransferase
MQKDFLKQIHEKVILGDGAIGTYIYEKGVSLGANTDLLNINDPDLIYSVHEEYIRAGSELIETNTFGANRIKLQKTGQSDLARELNIRGAQLALKAAGSDVYVAGSIGPTGLDFSMEMSDEDNADVEESFHEQISALIEGGVHLIILETFTHLEELLLALKITRRIDSSIPVVAQMVYPAGGKTALGLDAASCGQAAIDAGANVVGTNCGRRVKAITEAISRLSLIGQSTPLSAFTNAGIPEVIDLRTVYSTPPSYMADNISILIKSGVKLIGGCCGTTPAHIQAFRQKLRIKRPVTTIPISTVTHTEDDTDTSSSERHEGGLLRSFGTKKLPILVELDPPRTLDINHVMTGARELAKAGADAITLAEHPLAMLRTDNLSLAHLIKEQYGIETVLHLTCRDRNVLALQSQVIGAHLLGIRGILAITGDPASSSDQPGASGVFDVNSYGLIRMINGFNNGNNMAGHRMKEKTDFSIGAAFSFRPSNPGLQIRRLEKKASLGADFVMTQPLFDLKSVEEMVKQTSHIDLRIFPGIFPLISAKNADFLHNEIPGISIPEDIRKRLNSYDEVSDQRKVAMEYTTRLIEEIAPFVHGLYFISPLNKWEVVIELMESAGIAHK